MTVENLNECKVQGCDLPIHNIHGWCCKHYQQWRRHGDPEWRDKKPTTCTVDKCDRKIYARDICGMHYQRQFKYGDVHTAHIIVGGSDADRFWPKVEVAADETRCWPWLAATDKNGYGVFYCKEFNTTKAHRAAYQFRFGAISSELHVLHHCDNPRCVNPGHLFIGTNNDNMQDKIRKGRARYARGSKQGRAKLTEIEVREMRRQYAAGTSSSDLAKAYGVSQGNVNYIIARRTWTHIE